LNRIITVVATLLGLLLLGNGVFMLANSQAWYFAVPGVPDTGPFNPHFVRDIGFVYVLSGLGMLAGLVWPAQRLGLWISVAAWQTVHAAYHIWEVIVGICTPDALLRDFGGVTLPAIIACALVIWARRTHPAAEAC